MDEAEPSTVSFSDNRRAAESGARVRCPRCNKSVFMHDTRCEHCGLHFQGEAWQFSPSTHSARRSNIIGIPRWLFTLIVAATLIATMLAVIRQLAAD